MDLAALVDLEWLLRDGPESVDLDRERERAVARRVAKEQGIELAEARARVDADRDLRAAFARGWLEAVRTRRDDLPGTRIAHGLDVAGWILVIAGLMLGGGAAKTLLAYDGSVPVNVLHFATYLFGLQILLLTAMLVFVVRAHKPGKGGGPGLLHRPIGFLAGRFFGERGHGVADALRAMRARRALYADVERWTLFALAQRFGVSFNVGALVVAFGLVAFSDLVFSWSTTLDLDPATVHVGVEAVSLPWWWLPQAVPSLEVVEASQWARMQGTFVGGRSLAEALPLAAQWWRFLIAGLVAWGLVPRVVSLTAGSWRARRALRAASFDHFGYQELFDRLLPPSIGWEGPAPGEVEGQAPRSGRGPATPHAPSAPGAPTWIVTWGSLARDRDAAVAQLVRRFGADVRQVHEAGGADLAADESAVDALRQAGATRVAFVAAAGQQPTADVLGFLRVVRAALGAGRPIVVGLLDIGADGSCIDAADDERAAWRRALGTLDDPHLWVEAMEVGA